MGGGNAIQIHRSRSESFVHLSTEFLPRGLVLFSFVRKISYSPPYPASGSRLVRFRTLGTETGFSIGVEKTVQTAIIYFVYLEDGSKFRTIAIDFLGFQSLPTMTR